MPHDSASKGGIHIAIYHLEAKIISRGAGRSVVAAAAYASCSRLYNDYDGITHDYTRKRGCRYSEIFLSDTAPAQWKDRQTLWEAVETVEKAKNSRLARELIVALPIELELSDWKQILRQFIQEQCTSKGMCADVSIHDTDGHNPHAHILLTVRPLDQAGHWQAKTQKEYLCRRGPEEQAFTAEEFLTAKQDGWEKQYPYQSGKKKVYLTPSEAQDHPDYIRTSKSPKSTRYGRQNPISEVWNSEEQLLCWRKGWEDAVNLSLQQHQLSARIDCRSNADRGLEEQPTIHEGYHARNLEAMGIPSTRCALNRQIKEDNRLLKELKVQIQKLTKALKESIPAIASALESLRSRLITLQYHVLHDTSQQRAISEVLDKAITLVKEYKSVQKKITGKISEKKALQAEKKICSPLKFLQIRQFNQQISALTEEIEELKSRKTYLSSCLDCHSDSDMKAIQQKIEKMQDTQKRLKDQLVSLNEQKETGTLNFLEIKEKISPEDVDAVLEEREKLRPEKMQEVREHLEGTFQSAFRNDMLQKAEKIINSELQETESLHSILHRLHQKETALKRQSRTPKYHKDQER